MYCILHVICTWVAVTLIRNTIGFLCHFIPFSWKTKLFNSLIMYQSMRVDSERLGLCNLCCSMTTGEKTFDFSAVFLLLQHLYWLWLGLARYFWLEWMTCKEGYWKPTPWLSIWFHSDALSLTDRCNMLHSHPRTAWSASWSGWWPLGTSKEWLWIRSGTIAISCL